MDLSAVIDLSVGHRPGASALLLLLADSRLPAGGHAHSGGVEAACTAGTIHDEASLADFLAGRLASAGLVAAGLAAAAAGCWSDADQLALLDAEADARTASPALRAASRAQGRALLRAGRVLVAAPPPLGGAPHHPVALGALAGALGLDAHGAALVTASASVSGPASAAVRLLGLDPLAVTGVQAALAAAVDDVAGRAASGPLPVAAAPVLDLLAERHAARSVRLFAS